MELNNKTDSQRLKSDLSTALLLFSLNLSKIWNTIDVKIEKESFLPGISLEREKLLDLHLSILGIKRFLGHEIDKLVPDVEREKPQLTIVKQVKT